MKSFKFMGEYKDDNSLPTRVQEGAVQFKEPDINKFAIIANGIACGIFIVGLIFIFLSGAEYNFWGIIASLLVLVPHEFLHAIWMKGDVLMYTNIKRGILFVISTEDCTKGQFIWMSLFPTLIFGFLPLLIFIINPEMSFFAWLGVLSISMGAGDFCNIYFAIPQMPKNALTFLSGFHSYWYIPEE